MSTCLLEYDLGRRVQAFSTMRGSELPYPVLQPHQTHEAEVAVITSRDTVRDDLQHTDALVTDLKDFAIGVRTADCIPVLLYDPVRKAIGAVHAGWKGTRLRIAKAAVEKMSDVYGTSPSDLVAQIGPGIGPLSFQVGKEVVDAFAQAGFPMDEISFMDEPVSCQSAELEHGTQVSPEYSPMRGGWHIDLWKANSLVLQEAGVPKQNIRTAGICTYLRNDLFYSARRETIACQRIINVIKLI